MKKLITSIMVVCLLVAVLAPAAGAAFWRFHFRHSGTLTVWGTVNCNAVTPPLYQGHGYYCNIRTGWVPLWCNDYLTRLVWDACGNKSYNKVYVRRFIGPYWQLLSLADYIDANIAGSIVMPSMADSTGAIPEVYMAVDLDEWLADPRPPQESYDVVDGVCADLPGYLFGTTPFVFDSTAGPGDNPMQTTPLTATVHLDGEITLSAGQLEAIPTLTEWGLIIFGVLLIGWMAWAVMRRKRRAMAGI
jgi:hypothetical protein